jgi:hypothetical protein
MAWTQGDVDRLKAVLLNSDAIISAVDALRSARKILEAPGPIPAHRRKRFRSLILQARHCLGYGSGVVPLRGNVAREALFDLEMECVRREPFSAGAFRR